MTDQKLIDSFSTDIEKLLISGQSEPVIASDEYSEMLLLAQKLAAFDTRHKSCVEKSLRMELLARINNDVTFPVKAFYNKPLRLRQSWLVLFVLAVILALAVITLPPVRVLAQELIQRIGSYMITNKPSEAEIYIATQQSGDTNTYH